MGFAAGSEGFSEARPSHRLTCANSLPQAKQLSRDRSVTCRLVSEAGCLFQKRQVCFLKKALYAFGEMDGEGKRRLGDFAAQSNSEIQFTPTETSKSVFPAK